MKSIVKYYLLLILFTSTGFVAGQDHVVDSIITVLKNDRNDSVKVKHLNFLSLKCFNSDPDSSIRLSSRALLLSQKIKWEKGIAQSNHQLGLSNYTKGDFAIAFSFYNEAVEYWKKLNEKGGLSKSLGQIGNIFNQQGDYPTALSYYFEALKIDEDLMAQAEKNSQANAESLRKSKLGIGNNLCRIGVAYYHNKDYTKAEEYYLNSLKRYEEIKNSNGTRMAIANLGAVYQVNGNNEKALNYYVRALKMDEESEDKSAIAMSLANIGNVHSANHDYERALDYYLKALKFAKESQDKKEIVRQMANLGSFYISLKRYAEAEKCLKGASEINEEVGAKHDEMIIKTNLGDLYSITGRPLLALEYYKTARNLKDSLFDEEKSEEIGKIEARHAYNKQQAIAGAEHKKELELADEKHKRQQTISYCVVGGLMMALLFTALIFNRMRLIRKQKTVIENQKKLVDEKQKEVLDSIYYARRIQQALITPERYIEKHLERLMN